MGNDGGSIPTRRELVKEAAKTPTTSQIKESQIEQQEYLWTTDPISQKPLVTPVVSDAHGKLYNKDTIIEFLLEGTRKEDAERVTLGSVKSLKDVVEVKFRVADGTDGKASKTSTIEQWLCPITGDKLGPLSKAVYLVPCGHAFSGNAIKEVSGEKCLTCETDYASNDVIPIIPSTESDAARLCLRLKRLQESGLSHSLKKASGAKKRKKAQDETRTDDQVATAKADNQSTINNLSTASLTAKVLEAQQKKRKLDSDNVKSLFSTKKGNDGKNNDFMTRGFSVPVTTKR